LRVTLIASLGLNLFLLAGIGAHLARASLRPASLPTLSAATVAALAGRLPPADAGLLRQAFANREPSFDQARAAFRRDLNGVRQALAAEPFDHENYARGIAAARTDREAMASVILDALGEALPRMSPAGRRALATMRN
jgi:uncharacterized membrane protein